MHHTRRAVRMKRPLVRTASTAVQPAPRPLGKWARPEPGPSQSPDAPPAASSSKSAVPRARSWALPRLPPQEDTFQQPQETSSRSTPQARSWARRITPAESREKKTGAASRPLPLPKPRQQQRDVLPHLASRDTAPHQRDAAPHKGRPDGMGDTVDFVRSQLRKSPSAQQSPSTASRRPGLLSNILSKQRIKRESEDAQAVMEDEDEDEVLEEDREDQEDDEADTVQLTEAAHEEQKVEEEIEEDDVDLVSEDPRAKPRIRVERNIRYKEKERGSVVSRLKQGEEDVVLERRSRTRSDGQHVQAKAKGKKLKLTKRKPRAVQRDLFIPTMVTVGNFAKLLKVKPDTLRRRMIRVGMDAEASYDYLLTSEYASLLAMEFGWNPVVDDEAAFDIYPPPSHPEPSTLPIRPPVVTIMGHVDHGKTTLLDTLRSTSVAKGEAGGITQHIGAFSVPVPASGSSGDARTITFLDTPGHAAFSAMRARGAGVTDIIVLVVAADDGIMPQTREVIELINKEKVSVVVAINKIDKPGVEPSKVETALLAAGVQLETFGGDIPSVQVSGITGQGLDQLVETISALAEMQDLRAEREGLVQGYVIESKVQKGLGPVATVLVLRGCLKPTDHIIAGLANGKVRLLHDSNGKPVKVAYPGMAVTVSGWKVLPNAGDEVLKGSDSDIKKALANRERMADLNATLGDVELLNEQRRQDRDQKEKETAATKASKELEEDRKEDGPKELRLIIKADVSGSAEAVAGALQGIGNDIARTKIIATAVGDVTESDVMRAKAAGGLIVAFSVGVPRPVQSVAASQHVPWITSTIIYRLMEDVTAKVIELLPPIVEKRVTGEANVLQLFDIHVKSKQTMKVAGCRVLNGLVEKTKMARVIRHGEAVYEGRIETLKQFKKDVTEVSKGTECGIAFGSFSDLREGDIVQTFVRIEKPGIL